MSLISRQVKAIFFKEIREYRRNGNIIYALSILPLIFFIQPLIAVLTASSNAGPVLKAEHPLLYMLAIPGLVPASLASYAIVGERLQGTMEPLLTTPIKSRDLLLGKAAAAFVPSVAVSYLMFIIFSLLTLGLAHPGVASAVLQGDELIALAVFTPLLTLFSVWIGIAVSTRCKDPRTSSQLSVLAALPCAAVTSLMAFKVIPIDLTVALLFGAGLAVFDRVGWRMAAMLFNRERLVSAGK